MVRKTLEEFKNDMFKKFGSEYVVLGTEYKNNKTPIEIKHKCGNKFKVRPDLILNNYKTGCPFCCTNKLKTHDTFLKEVKEIFGDEYIVLGKYINADTLIEVKHNKCGKNRLVLPHRLLKKDECIYCFGSPKRTIESIKEELLERKLPFEYVDQEYKGNKYPVSFKCKNCNKVFKARPNDILSTNQKSCPHCSKRKISKAESIIRNILIKENIEFLSQRTFKDLTIKGEKRKARLKFDFSIILNNQEILLEFDGVQHFYATGRFSEEDVLKNHERDILKNEYCIKNNIPLMRITFKDYNNLTKIIKDLLSSTTIPDECKVVDPSGSKDSAALWDQYHSVDNIV